MDENVAHQNLARRDARAGIARVERDGPAGIGLQKWEAMDPAERASGTPEQYGYLCDEDEEIGYLAGVWECTPFDDYPGPYEVDEYMLLLEGSVVMALSDGTDVTIRAGEAFVLPQGLECQWKMPERVRKIFMIATNDGRTTSENASLTRVTTPALTSEHEPGDAIEVSRTVFANADGRMQIVQRAFPQAFSGPRPSAAARLITVTEGQVAVGGAVFCKGDTLYAHGDVAEDWSIRAGSQLIEARYLKPAR